MNKKAKLIFALALSLSLLFALSAVGAADNADIPDGSFSAADDMLLACKVSVTDADGEISAVSAENEENLLGGICSITVGTKDSFLNIPRSHSIMSLKDLETAESRIHISIPNNYCVSELFLHSEAYNASESKPLSLLPHAIADAVSADLYIPTEIFFVPDIPEKYFNTAMLSGTPGSIYTLEIILSPIGENADTAPLVCYDGGKYSNAATCDLGTELMPAGTPSGKDSETAHIFPCERAEDSSYMHKVLPMPESLSDSAALNAQQAFVVWELTYPNGTRLTVKPGETIKPYTSCTLSAVWKDIYVVCLKANDISAGYGDEINPEYAFTYTNLPADGSLELKDVFVSCAANDGTEADISSPLMPGTYSLWPLGGMLCSAETGESLDISEYRIFYTNGSLSVSPIDLTVTACADKPFIYDGTVKTADDYSAEGLYRGDSVLSVNYTGGVLFGSGKSGIDASSVMVADADGNDVTCRYNIKAGKDAQITVAPCSSTVTVTAKSLQKTYDGIALEASCEYDGEVTGLIGGDRLTVTSVSGTALTPSDNGVSRIDSVRITNVDTDVTEAYSSIVFIDGTLTVSKKAMTIAAVSAKKYYDGQKLAASALSGDGYTDGYRANGLISGHKVVSALVTGEGISAGTYTSKIKPSSVVIKDESGNDVTPFYDIKTLDGRLEIKERTAKGIPLTITAGSDSWIYDGSSHNCGTYQADGLLDGDIIDKVVFSSGSVISDAGTADNVIESYVIKSSSGSIVSDSKYSVTLIPGTLTVEPYPLTIVAVSDEKIYDGSELINEDASSGKLANPKHSMAVEYDVLLDGRKTPATQVGTYEKQFSNVTILSGNKDVTSNYSIKLVPGTLTVKAAPAGTIINDESRPQKPSSTSGLWLALLSLSVAALGAVVFIWLKFRDHAPVLKGVSDTDETECTGNAETAYVKDDFTNFKGK